MTNVITVITVPQVDGVRYLALTSADARAVSRDWAMLDATRPVASLDVYPDGTREWSVVAYGGDTPSGRAAIEGFAREQAGLPLAPTWLL